jgi:hypothetical protein
MVKMHTLSIRILLLKFLRVQTYLINLTQPSLVYLVQSYNYSQGNVRELLQRDVCGPFCEDFNLALLLNTPQT